MKKLYVALFFSLILIGCKDKNIEKINELESKVDELSQRFENLSKNMEENNKKLSENINKNIESQTAIFYRVLGETLPVFVPSETEEKIDSFSNEIEECIKNPLPEKYNELESKYIDFVTTTPPWIQEELFSQIKKVRLNLEYARILSIHKNDTDYFDNFIGDLNLFIISAKEYSKIEDVKTKQKEIISKKDEKIKKEVFDFSSKIDEISKDYKLNETAFNDFIKKFDDYEIFLQKNGKIEHISTIQKLKVNLTDAKNKYDDKNEYNKYINDFNDFVIQTKNSDYSLSKYSALRESFPIISGKHPERKNDSELLLEWTIYSDVRKDLREIDESLKNEQTVTYEFLDEKKISIKQLENQISSIKSKTIDVSALKKTSSRLNEIIANKRNVLIHNDELERDKNIISDSEQKIDKVLKELSNYSENISTANEKIFAKIESDISNAEKELTEIKHKGEVALKDVENKIKDARAFLADCRKKMSEMLSKENTEKSSVPRNSKSTDLNKLSNDVLVFVEGNGIIDSFYISKYEVTQSLYESVMETNPSDSKGVFKPVENVTWYDAVIFCNKLSETYGLKPYYQMLDGSKIVECDTTSDGYRLPTLAEWKFAANGGMLSKDFNYSGSNDVNEVAWIKENALNLTTYDVGLKRPNELGVYDMNGNVWEWCWDRNNFDNRCYVGGSFEYDVYACSCSFGAPAASKKADIGFRVVRSILE